VKDQKKEKKKFDPKDFFFHDPMVGTGDLIRTWKEYIEKKKPLSSGGDLRDWMQFWFAPNRLAKRARTDFERAGIFPNKEEERRAHAVQGKSEQEADKKFLRDYQAQIKSTPEGKKMIQDFQQGKIGIFHSITYESYVSRQGNTKEKRGKEQEKSVTPFSSWYKKFGKAGKNVISTISINANPKYCTTRHHDGSNKRVMIGIGFLLKGYPVMVSEEDVMSQNLGAMSDDLIEFWKDSGTAKRASKKVAKPIDPSKKAWKWADEVLLDNWSVNGTFIHEDILKNNFQDSSSAKAVCMDALKLGFPLFIMSSSEPIIIQDEEDLDDFIEEAFG